MNKLNTLKIWIGVFSLLVYQTSVAQVVNEMEATQLLLKGCGHSTVALTQEYLYQVGATPAEKKAISEALPLWKKLVESKPTNANYNFKLGLCYFYSADLMLKGLPYFRNATKDMTDKYVFKNAVEDRAPFTALYFLAKCYLENEQPDSALIALMRYQDSYLVCPISCQKEVYAALNNLARKNRKDNRKLTVLPAIINMGMNESNPVVNKANNLLFFSATDPKNANSDIYYSVKNPNGEWQAPQPFQYNSAADESPVFITMDGKTFYFRKNVSNQNDIYFSKLEDGNWTPPVPFSDINFSGSDENSMSITDDGKQIYFTSNRDKLTGSFDIYHCELMANGKWSAADKLPQPINSAYNEDNVLISGDGQTLFFNSDGNGSKGFGGYDLWYSHLSANKIWSKPENVGFPVNCARNDWGYSVANDNVRYFSHQTGTKGFELVCVTEGSDTSYHSLDLDLTQATSELVRSQLELIKKDTFALTKALKPEVAPVIKETPLVKGAEVKPVAKVEEPKAEPKPEVVAEAKAAPVVKAEEPKAKPALVAKPKTVAEVNPQPVVKTEEKQGDHIQTVYFGFNETELSSKAKTDLDKALTYLKQHAQAKIQLVGHADSKGDWNKNMSIALNRGKMVRNYLVEKGADSNRILYYGQGCAYPADKNDTPEAQGKNRRVDISVIVE